MTDRPIIFSAPMVRALLAERKSQTRRVLPAAHPRHPQHNQLRDGVLEPSGNAVWYWDGVHDRVGASYPLRYAPGDRLWVREAFKLGLVADWPCIDYRATCETDPPTGFPITADQYLAHEPKRGGWSSPIFIPRWASRLTLTVTDVRVQRVQEISEDDARAEGVTRLPGGRFDCGADDDGPITCKSPVTAFANLWNSLHGPDAWDANPWVCAVSFEVWKGNIDANPD